jgi:flagella basal body P-ring formation protein FlgA
MHRLLVLFLGFSLGVSALRAQTAPSPAVTVAEPWLDTLGALLVKRYQTTGELRLSWNRARPAAAAVQPADLIVIDAPAELAPQILVTVRAFTDAGVASEHTLVLRAELWRDGCVLREPGRTGDLLEPASVEPRRFDILRERESLPIESVVELNFARNVPAGRLLAWRDVVRRPLVRRGQVLDVLATYGSLTVTLRAVALNDAGRGETVRVRNPDSKKDFVAEVVSESRAAVRF